MATGAKFSSADMPEGADDRRVNTYRSMLGVLNWVSQITYWNLLLACLISHSGCETLQMKC